MRKKSDKDCFGRKRLVNDRGIRSVGCSNKGNKADADASQHTRQTLQGIGLSQ